MQNLFDHGLSLFIGTPRRRTMARAIVRRASFVCILDSSDIFTALCPFARSYRHSAI
jgi:hypothetical protein